MANSLCGTYEYVAPEVLNKQGYGKSCDWWSFGCVLYEMLTAIPPFYSKKRDELLQKIRFKNPNFYNFHSQDSIDLISQLLIKDPSRRLGSESGASEIKKHPFFAGINWDLMLQKKLPTPYKPLLDSKYDTKHFAEEFSNIPIESPPGQDGQSGNFNNSNSCCGGEENNDFEGFTFEAQTL